MASTLFHFIGGNRAEGTSGRFGDVYNPATGEVTALQQDDRLDRGTRNPP